MKLDKGLLSRQIGTGLAAVALAIGACSSAYKAGCTHTGAGASLVSLDFQLASTWQAIPSLVLFTALFTAPVASSLRRSALRAIAFLLVATPLAFAALMHIESKAEEECLAAKQDGGKAPSLQNQSPKL